MSPDDTFAVVLLVDKLGRMTCRSFSLLFQFVPDGFPHRKPGHGCHIYILMV